MATSPAAILYDANGRALALEDTVALAGGGNQSGLLVMGIDGLGKARHILVDQNNFPYVCLYGNDGFQVPVVPGTAPPAGTRGILALGTDGTNARVLKTDSAGVVQMRAVEEATFIVGVQDVAIGNAKSMLSLLNASGSTVTLKLRELLIQNVQVTANTGVADILELRRFTGHSAGTVATPLSYDTADSLNASVTARTGATIAGEAAALLDRWIISTDDWGPGTLDVEALQTTFQTHFPIWKRRDASAKPITLHAGEGIHLKNATNSTAGTLDVVFVFTQV